MPKNLGERLLDYLEKNLIVAIGATSTLFGLCVINAFFFHIEYSPTFDLQAWASAVFSATYVGIALMVMFGILLFLPTFYIGFLILGTKNIKVDEDVKSQLIRQQVFFSFLFSILFALILFALEFKQMAETTLVLASIALAWVLVAFMLHDKYVVSEVDKLNQQPKKNIAATEINLLVGNSVEQQKPSKQKFTNNGGLKCSFFRKCWPKTKKIFEFGFHASVLGILYFYSAYLFFVISSGAISNVGGHAEVKNVIANIITPFALVTFTGVFLVLAWFNPKPSKLHRTLACIAVFLTPILASALAGNVAFLWMRVANTTKIGNFYVDEITINKHGCEVLSENGIDLCNTKIGDSYKIHDVYVMSRIGSETFLKINVNGKVKEPCSSPQAAKKDNIDSSIVDAEKEKETKGKIVNETENNLRDILMPSADIQGLKISALPAAFSLAAINEFMKDKRSICATASAPEKKIFSFKESDLFEFGQYVTLNLKASKNSKN